MLTRVVARSTFFAAIIALALASISATSVFAAGLVQRNSDGIGNTGQTLASQWKFELAALKTAQYMDGSIGKWATRWMMKKQRSRYRRHKEARYEDTVNLALRDAEIVSTNHSGFDRQGQVINKAQATQSLQSLILDLHTFHLELRDRLLILLHK